MVAFKAFDPDPDVTDPDDDYFGTGTWHYDDGTSAYGQGDRDEALALYKPPAQPDERLAFNDADAAEWASEGGQQQADVGPPPMLARPPEASTPAEGSMGERPQDETGGINIPKRARIAYVHNNPGNLKFAGQEGAHQGEPAEDGGHWAAFETPEEGVAALNRQIELDAGRGKTVREFISKYAPPNSNDTATYIRQASEALGADPDAKLADIDRSKVMAFMAQKESGTTLGGTSLPQSDAVQRPAAPGLGIPGGLNPAMAEMRGVPLTPQQLQDRQQGIMDSTMTQVGGVQQAAAARMQGREEALKVVADQSERFKADQQAQLDLAVRTKAEAEQNVQNAMATQLDPGRVIKNMGTGNMILGALAIIGGTVGNALAMSKGQRTVSATDWIGKAIDDDLEQQKEDKRSRVAHWTSVFKDADMGMKAARAEMWNAAGKLAEYKANTSAQNADIAAQMMQESATMIANGQKEAQGLVDKENERLSIRYAPPDPKKDGAVDALANALKLDQSLEQSGYSREQREQMMAKMGLPPPVGESTREQKSREDKEAVARKDAELTEGEGKAEAGWQTVQQYGDSVGLKRDPKTGKYVADGLSDMLVAPGLKEVIPGALGKGSPIAAAREAAIDGLARLQTGAAISKEEEERFGKLLGDRDATRAQIATNLNALEALIQTRRKQNRVKPTSAPEGWK